jgi:hypothetical protein
MLVAAPGAALAQGEEHNCAGAITSTFAGPGFGGAVAAAADQQVVDNFGLADCGQDNRNNP